MLLEFISLPEGQPVKLGDGHAKDLVELFLGQMALEEEGRRQEREQLEDVRGRWRQEWFLYVSSGSAVPGTVSDPKRVCDEYLSSG